jgi:methylmalonyl-CoA decarboxylase
MSYVITTIEDSIGTIMLNHGQKRNALSQPLIADILEALGAFRQQNLRVIILRAQEGATVWSAGHDVSELPQGHRDPLGWDDPLRRLIRELENYPAPIIAMIEGSVWGGACEVAFACDLVIAADDTTFAITPAKLGVPYNLSGLLTFMNTISLHIVKEMAFTASPIKAERAERLGIVNHIVSKQELTKHTYEIAKQIVRNSPLSIAIMKEELNLLANAHDLSPLMFERIQSMRRVVYNSQDYQEGIQAFLEKRLPKFLGK